MERQLSVEDILRGDALAYRLACVLAAADVTYAVQLYALGQIAGTILGPEAPVDIRQFWDLVFSVGTGEGGSA